MKAGDLKCQIVLQAETVTQNGFGEGVRSYSTQATVRAAWEPLAGREFIAAEKVSADVTGRFRIRARADLEIKPNWRVLKDGEVYDVVAVISPKDSKVETHLMVKRLVMGEQD